MKLSPRARAAAFQNQIAGLLAELSAIESKMPRPIDLTPGVRNARVQQQSLDDREINSLMKRGAANLAAMQGVGSTDPRLRDMMDALIETQTHQLDQLRAWLVLFNRAIPRISMGQPGFCRRNRRPIGPRVAFERRNITSANNRNRFWTTTAPPKTRPRGETVKQVAAVTRVVILSRFGSIDVVWCAQGRVVSGLVDGPGRRGAEKSLVIQGVSVVVPAHCRGFVVRFSLVMLVGFCARALAEPGVRGARRLCEEARSGICMVKNGQSIDARRHDHDTRADISGLAGNHVEARALGLPAAGTCARRRHALVHHGREPRKQAERRRSQASVHAGPALRCPGCGVAPGSQSAATRRQERRRADRRDVRALLEDR